MEKKSKTERIIEILEKGMKIKIKIEEKDVLEAYANGKEINVDIKDVEKFKELIRALK